MKFTYIGDQSNKEIRTAGSYANSAYLTGNSAFVQANSAYDSQNTTGVYANSAYTQANTSTNNAAGASLYANGAFIKANTATNNAAGASLYANGAFILANAAYEMANSGSGSYTTASFLQANSAFASQNTTGSYANSAYNSANSAGLYANSAFTKANNALPLTGGTITGSLAVTQDVSVTGNLTVLGTSTSINTSSFTVQDSMLVLGLGNYTSDLLDIGFASHYNDGSNAHTGLIRDASEKQWMFFEGYTPEVSPNNDIIITDPSFKYANVRARDFTGNLIANTVTVNGYDLFTYTTSAYTQANTATTNASGASLYANAAYIKANSAYTRANNSVNANTGGTITGDITITGNLIVSGANVALGNVGNVHIYGGNTGQVLVTDNNGNLSFIDLPTTSTTVYTASTLTLTNGVYVSGSVTDTQVLNDGNSYQITDGSNTGPAWIITTTFTGVVAFNRVVSNIDYTLASGHTVYFQLYNYNTSTWDNIGSYSGANGYSQYALEVLGYSSYISAGTVQVRLYHSNTGSVSHATKLDYIALELSAQGAQGPRGATGATGATGSGVATGGTAGQVLIKNSSTNYDTAWSNNVIDAWNQANTATNNASGASLYANAAFAQANTGSADTYARDTANAAFAKANTASNNAISIYTDQFTANGLTTTFTLSANPPDENFVTAVVDGIIQLRSTYTVTNNIITFDSTFESGAKVEVTTLSGNSVINTGTSGGVSTGKSIAMSIIFGI